MKRLFIKIMKSFLHKNIFLLRSHKSYEKRGNTLSWRFRASPAFSKRCGELAEILVFTIITNKIMKSMTIKNVI